MTAGPAPGRGAADDYLATLDGWRAVAILLVVADHVWTTAWCQAPASRWCTAVPTGQHGVNLFFGISGLLICSRLLKERRERGSISLRGFYIRRAFRILPPALVYLATLSVLGLLGALRVLPVEIAAAVFFFRNYLPTVLTAGAATGLGLYTLHFWSLAVEEHFYLVWPAVLKRLGNARALWAAVVVSLAVAWWRGSSLQHQITHDYLRLTEKFRTDLRLDGLLLGCVMAILMERPAARAWLRTQLTPRAWAGVLALWLGVLWRYGEMTNLWESALVPLLLAGTVLRPDAPVGRLLERALMRWLGRLSYSLYLWQQLFFPNPLSGRPTWIQRAPWSLGAALACAAASYYLIERPMIRLGHRLAPPVAPGPHDAAAT